MSRTVTVHIDDVPSAAITDVVIAMERARAQGIFDHEQLVRQTPLINGLRRCRDVNEGGGDEQGA